MKRGWISGEVSLASWQVATILLCSHIVLSVPTEVVQSLSSSACLCGYCQFSCVTLLTYGL